MVTEPKNNELLTINEVCKKYRASRMTVYRWRRDGLISAIKVGHSKVLFNADRLANELEVLTGKPQTQTA